VSAAALALVLVAAASHAAWNALAKRAHDPLAFMWFGNLLGGLWLLIWAVVELRARPISAAAWPFVLASTALHGAYFYALSRAYAAGDYSLVYPVARGLSVALVPLLALALLGERLSALGVAGIALVLVGIAVSGRAARPVGADGRPAASGAALGWAVLTGLTIAAYSLNDRAGVALVHPAVYLAFTGLGLTALLWLPLRRRPGALAREWRANRGAIAVGSVLMLGAYLLVLFAFQLSKTGYVVAARETSIAFSALLGSLWLREGRLAPRLAGAAIIVAGVACIALAR
jgi:drug/metabolite transporter (DMT)-like permease